MGDLILPGPKRAANMGIVACAASPCSSRGLALPLQDGDHSLAQRAPEGWLEIPAINGQGIELVLFVCSPSCVRRLAGGFVLPGVGEL